MFFSFKPCLLIGLLITSFFWSLPSIDKISLSSPYASSSKATESTSTKAIKCGVQDFQGRLLVAGEINENNSNKIFLELRDILHNNSIIKDTVFSFEYAVSINTILQTHDGLYALGGNKSNGQLRNAYLLILDENFNLYTERIINPQENGTINDLAQDASGNLYAVGSLNDHMYICTIAFSNFEVIPPIMWQEPSVGKSIAVNQTGDFFITGQAGHLLDPNMMVWAFNSINNRLNDIYRLNKAEGTDILLDDQEDIYITGIYYAPFKKEEAMLLKLSKRGNPITFNTCCGYGMDRGISLVKSINQDIYVLGYSTSIFPGSRTPKKLIWKLDADDSKDSSGTILPINSQKPEAEVLDIAVPLHNGNFVAIGKEIKSNSLTNSIEIIKLQNSKRELLDELGRNEVSINTNPTKIEDEKKDAILYPLERCFKRVSVVNNTNQIASGLWLNIDDNGSLKGLKVPKHLDVGHIPPSSSKDVFIPIKGYAQLEAGKAVFSVKLRNPLKIFGNKQFTIQTAPKIIVTNTQPSKKTYSRGSKEVLQFLVENKSVKPTNNIKLVLETCYGQDEERIHLPGTDKISVNLIVYIGQDHFADFLPFHVSVYEKDQLIQTFNDSLYLEKNYSFLDANQNAGIYLTSPNADDFCSSNIFRLKDDVLNVEATIITRTKLTRDELKCRSCTFFYEGFEKKAVKNIGKAGLAKINFVEQRDGYYWYKFEQAIRFSEIDRNKIVKVWAQATINEKQVKSKTAFIEFKPVDLYLLPIGIPYKNDLKYTYQDALAFREAFARQEKGNIFRKVEFLDAFLTDSLVTKNKLKKYFDDLHVKLTSQKTINESDLLIVFISSHGDSRDGQFQLLSTNYLNNSTIDNYVDFKDVILSSLEKLPCKVLLLIDACHSGGAKSGLQSNVLIGNLIEHPKGIAALASCREDEKSYECENYRQGAFTEGLKRALTGKADQNYDKIITLGELFRFLRDNVPALVNANNCIFHGPQNPIMPRKGLDDNIAIYSLELDE